MNSTEHEQSRSRRRPSRRSKTCLPFGCLGTRLQSDSAKSPVLQPIEKSSRFPAPFLNYSGSPAFAAASFPSTACRRSWVTSLLQARDDGLRYAEPRSRLDWPSTPSKGTFEFLLHEFTQPRKKTW